MKMDKFKTLYQLSLADFRERTRRYSFLVTMLGVLFFSYLVITGKYTVQFGDCRPVYDSAWAGSLMAVCGSIMLTLAGFYLVKGSIARDRKTEVGQIVATTPISGRMYIVSKMVSNMAVLWFMMIVLAAAAFLTLLYRNESGTFDLWAFISPFLIIALPATIFVASVAVFFDTTRWLRGSLGNVVYLFLAEFCIVFGMLHIPFLDLGGISVFVDSARSAAAAAFPGEKIGLLMGFVGFDEAMRVKEFKIFPWDGISWTTDAILLRLFWMVAAGAVAGAAVPFFDRFDPAKIRRKKAYKEIRSDVSKSRVKKSEVSTVLTYEQLSLPKFSFNPIHMLGAELRLALKGRHWFWYIVAIGLPVAQLAAPFNIARLYLVPGAMVWPLIIWSSMGTREPLYNTGSLLLSSPQPLMRQFPAIWLTGVLIALAAVGCAVIRAMTTGHWLYAATLLAGAVFIPTAALAMGTLSGGRKLFEVLYLITWYVGSIDHLAPLDLLGTTAQAVTASKIFILGLLSIVLLISAFLARRMQLLRS